MFLQSGCAKTGASSSPSTPLGLSLPERLASGSVAGAISTAVCYPLDTVRRRMQMKGKTYNGMLDALSTIARKEGVGGFFKGWAANTLKVVPQNSIRFVAYETLKTLFGVATTPI